MKKINYFRFNSLAAAIVCSGVIFTSVLTSQAEVRTTKFDSPVLVSLVTAISDGLSFCFSPDFNHDGLGDYLFFHRAYETLFDFNSPSSIVVQKPYTLPPYLEDDYAWVAALPLGSTIGEELSYPEVDMSAYSWSEGDEYTGSFPYDYISFNRSAVLTADGVLPSSSAISGSENVSGKEISEVEAAYSPFVKGNVLGKEGVIGIKVATKIPASYYAIPLPEYYTYYGYIHFYCPNERTICFLGYSFESEWNQPIVAEPLAIPPTKIQFSIQKLEDGGLELSWLATPGATYQAERSFHSEGPFEKVGEEIVPVPTSGAKPVQEKVIISKEEARSSQTSFWRIVRLK